MAYQQPDPFWEFIRSFDPNTASPGGPNNAGGNNNNNNNNFPPDFLRGFPFFSHPAHAAGYNPHHGPGHRGRGRRHGPPPQHPWAAGPYAWGDWPFHQQQQQPPQQQEEAQQQARQRMEDQLRQQREQQQRQQEEQQQQQQQQQQQRGQEQAKEKEKSTDKDSSPDTMMGDSDAPDPAEVTPDESDDNTNPNPYPRGHCRRGRRHRDRQSGRQPDHDHQQGPFPFDLGSLLSTISSHPILQNLQAQAQAGNNTTSSFSSSAGTFAPPLDLFNTPTAYILHLSLPGALKPDVGVDWDPERNVLRVAGVVHRPGDEAFQATLVQGERRVGVFEREVKLPPARPEAHKDTEEIDADGITAKMEDGVLIVTVPKVEKEWTEIRKVDIE